MSDQPRYLGYGVSKSCTHWQALFNTNLAILLSDSQAAQGLYVTFPWRKFSKGRFGFGSLVVMGGGFGGLTLVGSSFTFGVTDPDREGCLVV